MILNQMLSTHFQQFKIKNLKLRMAWNLQQSRPGRRPNSWAKYEFCAQVLRCGWIIWNLGARIQKYVLRSWCGIPACFVDWTFQYINAVESAESQEKNSHFHLVCKTNESLADAEEFWKGCLISVSVCFVCSRGSTNK